MGKIKFAKIILPFGIQLVPHVGSIWIQPWANFPKYLDGAL